ncbi:MAG: hypothetical protein C4329_12610 [Chitinophagaceae bacterium]
MTDRNKNRGPQSEDNNSHQNNKVDMGGKQSTSTREGSQSIDHGSCNSGMQGNGRRSKQTYNHSKG